MGPVFDYNEAFCRNLGWISLQESEHLKRAKVAIGGSGGVGGVHLITLVRLGITHFHLADPDTFELKNFNRQYGADMSTLGQNKCEIMCQKAVLINPELRTRIFKEGISKENIGEFLNGVDIYVDGIDLFEIEIREIIFSECQKRNIPCVSAAPIGMGTSVINFSPSGMSFEKYFGVSGRKPLEKVIRFSLGMAPSFVHLSSLVAREYSNLSQRRVSSTPMGCQFASGVVGTEVLKILLGRGPVKYAPHVIHYDGYSYKLKKSCLWFGHLNPLFQIKLKILKWALSRLNRNSSAA
ncbi:MAG: ThiF family adenylyltransferase [Bdellovibrionaceae bacterium]|nr:ThiF family adenylyltransferase [Pseudobdellovibrionaceae bacterium]